MAMVVGARARGVAGRGMAVVAARAGATAGRGWGVEVTERVAEAQGMVGEVRGRAAGATPLCEAGEARRACWAGETMHVSADDEAAAPGGGGAVLRCVWEVRAWGVAAGVAEQASQRAGAAWLVRGLWAAARARCLRLRCAILSRWRGLLPHTWPAAGGRSPGCRQEWPVGRPGSGGCSLPWCGPAGSSHASIKPMKHSNTQHEHRPAHTPVTTLLMAPQNPTSSEAS